MNAKTWGAILYLAIPATGVAFCCQSLAQRRLSPVATAIILATEPAFATLFSLAPRLRTFHLETGRRRSAFDRGRPFKHHRRIFQAGSG